MLFDHSNYRVNLSLIVASLTISIVASNFLFVSQVPCYCTNQISEVLKVLTSCNFPLLEVFVIFFLVLNLVVFIITTFGFTSHPFILLLAYISLPFFVMLYYYYLRLTRL